MPKHRVFFEVDVDADSPEDAAIILRDMLKAGSPAGIFFVDVADGKVAVDTEAGNECVVRDDRKRIGPEVMRREGPTGVLTSPVLADFYRHDKVTSVTDLEQLDGKYLRLCGCGPEAYYEWVSADGVKSEPFAVITVKRKFDVDMSATTHLALAAYAQNSHH